MKVEYWILMVDDDQTVGKAKIFQRLKEMQADSTEELLQKLNNTAEVPSCKLWLGSYIPTLENQSTIRMIDWHRLRQDSRTNLYVLGRKQYYRNIKVSAGS